MNTPVKAIILIAVSIVLVSSGYTFLFNGSPIILSPSDDTSQDSHEMNDTSAPTITSISGDLLGDAGSTITITTTFEDDVAVTSAKLYYKPATAIAWSSKSILSGFADLPLPPGSNESWYYYITIDDAAGNGPIGDPSTDGSNYYTIIVMDIPVPPPNENGTDDHFGDTTQNSSRFVFIELGTKIVCSECPKISLILNELYASGDYPFYYVSLPQDNPKALARINDYNIWGYPTAYIDGGITTLVGSTIEKSDFEQSITDAAVRITPQLFITTSAEWNNQTDIITVTIKIENHEPGAYQERLLVYITELISTKWQAGTPMHFSFLDFLVNEDVNIPGNDQFTLTKTLSASEVDPENIMLFSVLFSSEKQTGYSQPPDKNPYDIHGVDAVSTTRVIQGGNLPPEVGIQNPSVKYFHRFGTPIRKSMTGKTVVVGKATIVASAHDDSKITKVEFYINNKLMETVTQEPYQWMWHKFSFGRKTITVKAFDDSGKQSTATIDVLAFML
jgi:Bacterial Ig domain